jgi:GNAT superfamily N-acetyltransferase
LRQNFVMVPFARRAESEAELVVVHGLLVEAFAYMDGRIDPPSSMAKLTVAELLGGPGEVWVVGDPIVACVVLTPTDESLYIGKLAVRNSERGSGLARVLINHAEHRAQQLGLPILELQTRIELTENHRTFASMGFVEHERTAHFGYSRPTSITFRKPVPRTTETWIDGMKIDQDGPVL